MPMMIAYELIELIITATYVRVDHPSDFAASIPTAAAGRRNRADLHGIFHRQVDRRGRRRPLRRARVETRGFAGPHAYDATGIPSTATTRP
jgi:hypothetical protein